MISKFCNMLRNLEVLGLRIRIVIKFRMRVCHAAAGPHGEFQT